MALHIPIQGVFFFWDQNRVYIYRKRVKYYFFLFVILKKKPKSLKDTLIIRMKKRIRTEPGISREGSALNFAEHTFVQRNDKL